MDSKEESKKEIPPTPVKKLKIFLQDEKLLEHPLIAKLRGLAPSTTLNFFLLEGVQGRFIHIQNGEQLYLDLIQKPDTNSRVLGLIFELEEPALRDLLNIASEKEFEEKFKDSYLMSIPEEYQDVSKFNKALLLKKDRVLAVTLNTTESQKIEGGDELPKVKAWRESLEKLINNKDVLPLMNYQLFLNVSDSFKDAEKILEQLNLVHQKIEREDTPLFKKNSPELMDFELAISYHQGEEILKAPQLFTQTGNFDWDNRSKWIQ